MDVPSESPILEQPKGHSQRTWLIGIVMVSLVLVLAGAGVWFYFMGQPRPVSVQVLPVASPTDEAIPSIVPGEYIDGHTEVEAFCEATDPERVAVCVKEEQCGQAADECQSTCVQTSGSKECLDACTATYTQCLNQ